MLVGSGAAFLCLTANPGTGTSLADLARATATIRAAWDNARRGGTVVVVGAGRGAAMVRFSAQELFLHDKRLLEEPTKEQLRDS